MSKQQYRSELGTISDILSATMEGGKNGIIISTICRMANLSHYIATEKCRHLVDVGLIEQLSSEQNRIFSITEKGIRFYQELQQFKENIQEIKIRF